MLTLNVAEGSSVTVGFHKIWVKEINTSAGEVRFQTDGPRNPLPMILSKGTTTQIFPDVMMHFKKILHGSQTLVRLGFDAPRSIKIDNNTGRPPKVNFAEMDTEDLIAHSARWSRSTMEDELRIRLQEAGEILTERGEFDGI